MTMTLQEPVVPASPEGLEASCRRLMAEIVKLEPKASRGGFDAQNELTIKRVELNDQLDLWNIVSSMEA